MRSYLCLCGAQSRNAGPSPLSFLAPSPSSCKNSFPALASSAHGVFSTALHCCLGEAGALKEDKQEGQLHSMQDLVGDRRQGGFQADSKLWPHRSHPLRGTVLIALRASPRIFLYEAWKVGIACTVQVRQCRHPLHRGGPVDSLPVSGRARINI